MTCLFSTVKPSPPVNLTHIQNIEAELILHWDDLSDSTGTGLLRYEVRYSFNTRHPAWQVNTDLLHTAHVRDGGLQCTIILIIG